MTLENWQIVLAVAALLVACAGPTLAWAAHLRSDSRWQGRIDGKLDEIKALMAKNEAATAKSEAVNQREHDQIRELAEDARNKADRLSERLATGMGARMETS